MTQPYAMDKRQAAAHVGLSVEAISKAINADHHPLPARKYTGRPDGMGGKWMIRTADLEEWFDGLEGNYAADKKAAS